MSPSVRGKIDRYYEEMLNAEEREEAKGKPLVSGDVVEFCEKQLGFKPFTYQEKLLRDPSQFIVARWSRQSGKSYTMAALILYHALASPGSRIVVLAPSLRQSRIIIRKISNFLSRLPGKVLEGRVLKTRLELMNGSSIEAFPNSPATIRGETLHMVFADELSFVQNDAELYDAIVYALGTTNGRFVATSTPGSRDSLFYSMCTDDNKFGNVSRHHVTYQEALDPNGPLKGEILERIRRQMVEEPWRWRREMDAEFVEDDDAWLPFALITKCVDENHEYKFDENSIV